MGTRQSGLMPALAMTMVPALLVAVCMSGFVRLSKNALIRIRQGCVALTLTATVTSPGFPDSVRRAAQREVLLLSVCPTWLFLVRRPLRQCRLWLPRVWSQVLSDLTRRLTLKVSVPVLLTTSLDYTRGPRRVMWARLWQSLVEKLRRIRVAGSPIQVPEMIRVSRSAKVTMWLRLVVSAMSNPLKFRGCITLCIRFKSLSPSVLLIVGGMSISGVFRNRLVWERVQFEHRAFVTGRVFIKQKLRLWVSLKVCLYMTFPMFIALTIMGFTTVLALAVLVSVRVRVLSYLTYVLGQ